MDHGRRNFEPDELWDPEELVKERPPRVDQPLVHWRVFDVALAASRWTVESESDRVAAKPTLPAVLTPDGDLLEMIKRHGARALVDERDYFGVEYDDEELVLVQEADRSRRLLRDSECRARSRINWGYGGSGPYDLASLLVADALGPLAYCPSCFGAIGAAGGLIDCQACENGMRPGLWEMQRAATGSPPGWRKRPACYRWQRAPRQEHNGTSGAPTSSTSWLARSRSSRRMTTLRTN